MNVSSCHALAAVPGQTAYCGSKAAAARIMEIIHLGAIPYLQFIPKFAKSTSESPNIRCFSLHPGAVDTELLKHLERTMDLELRWRWTEPELTGATILWLANAQADFLRGRWLSTNWRVDELQAREHDIVQQNMLKMAFNAVLGITSEAQIYFSSKVVE